MDLFVKQSVGHARNKSKQWCADDTARRVQELARYRATRQLLRASSQRFSQAQQDYLDWESFSLWVQATVEAEGGVPSWIDRTLQRRCPGFLEFERHCREAHPQQAAPLPVLLLEWIHDRVFMKAKEEGWLDALIFFSFRHPYSQRTWAYWEHCEDDWKRKRPARYPSFDEWRMAAESGTGPGPGSRKQRAAGN